MSTNVPDHLSHLEELSPREIEERLITFREMNERELTEDQLEEVVALHAICMRKTAGPPKSRGAKEPPKSMDLNDFAALIKGGASA